MQIATNCGHSYLVINSGNRSKHEEHLKFRVWNKVFSLGKDEYFKNMSLSDTLKYLCVMINNNAEFLFANIKFND